MRIYQKLAEPQLIELESEPGFLIISEIDMSEMKNGLILMKGKSFSYDSTGVTEGRVKEIQYSLKEEVYYDV